MNEKALKQIIEGAFDAAKYYQESEKNKEFCHFFGELYTALFNWSEQHLHRVKIKNYRNQFFNIYNNQFKIIKKYDPKLTLKIRHEQFLDAL